MSVLFNLVLFSNHLKQGSSFYVIRILVYFKGGQNWILCQVEKIVFDEKNKLFFIRPKTDNSYSRKIAGKNSLFEVG